MHYTRIHDNVRDILGVSTMKTIYVFIFSIFLIGCSKQYDRYYDQYDEYSYQYTGYSEQSASYSDQSDRYLDRYEECLNWHDEYLEWYNRCQNQYGRYSEWYNRCQNQYGNRFSDLYDRICPDRYNSHSTEPYERNKPIIIPYYNTQIEDEDQDSNHSSWYDRHVVQPPYPYSDQYREDINEIQPSADPFDNSTDIFDNPADPFEDQNIDYQYLEPEHLDTPDSPPDIIDNRGEQVATPMNILSNEIEKYFEGMKHQYMDLEYLNKHDNQDGYAAE